MGTIAENLLALQQAKTDIKTAIESKGQNLSGVPFTEYATKITLISGGGSGGATDGDYFVKVIDYDGTILKEANLNSGDTFTLPNAPSHDGLVFQEWSCSQDIVDNTITIEDNNVMVGAVYTTASGLSEFDIEITKAMEPDISTNGFVVTLNMDGTKDWGDGTSDDLTTHTYSAYGEYTIKCNGTTMTTSSSSGLFGQNNSVPNKYCVNVRLANVTILTNYAFCQCRSLTTITIPNSVTSVNTAIFYNCPALTTIVMPSDLKSITTYNAFYSCYALTSVVLPKGITGIERYAFQYCYSLRDVVIPNGVISIYESSFASCFNIQKIIIPKGVFDIQQNTFNGCYGLTSVVILKGTPTIGNYAFNSGYAPKKYDFTKLTSIPTLSGSQVFYNLNQTSKIIVPDNLYDEWIVATNWATYADYIYKASEVQE